MKPTSTKDKILYVLKKDVELSIKEIRDYFSISEVAIRRHLNDLIREGFVKEKIVKQDIGRPYHLYSLTNKGHTTFPNKYEELPLEILSDLATLYGDESVTNLLTERKKREEKELSVVLQDKVFPEQVTKLIEFQEERGYMIEYEELQDGTVEIKNFNCPIYSLASEYKEICRNEHEMYDTLFQNSEVKFTACMTDGEKYCRWLISKPEAQ
ncbi:MAG TPA: ArsR family transcriptional regulator [Pseudogracilibacillus sp.]|nr:ArsR family transcriptional regulator [Pseudogracilibacillus sp.]